MTMHTGGHSEEEVPAVSTGYAHDQLRRAIETALTHPHLGTRERAASKALAWDSVLSGMSEGVLEIGSRTPVADTPAWVTLEVVHGGFATGSYAAEGPIEPWEAERLSRLPASGDDITDRQQLNSWFLSDEGLNELQRALAGGHYEVRIPEEGALLTVAWLLEHGHDSAAVELVGELYPMMDRLRLYPLLTSRPRARGSEVHLRSVGELATQLGAIETPRDVTAMNEAITVWNPLVDRLVELWIETVESDWPCRVWPSDWVERRRAWLSDFERAVRDHGLNTRHSKPRSTLTVLRSALERCPHDSSALSPRDVGRLRQTLDAAIAKRGVPGSPEHQTLRLAQAGQTARPTRSEIAEAVGARLNEYPADGGIADLRVALAPVTTVGHRDRPVSVPSSMVRKVERAWEAPVDELVDRGVIRSSEQLASVMPQISSRLAAAGLPDAPVRGLYAQVYEAFRRRRSLLLLNLEQQIDLKELPWVGVLEGFRAATERGRQDARRALADTVLLTLSAFPQAILPNPLIRELAALAEHAGLETPLVEEIAADIFMSAFTQKWRQAAEVTSSLLAGSLYGRYFDLPPVETWSIPESRAGFIGRITQRHSKRRADDFARLCADRATEAGSVGRSFVARNGAVLEQAQILTSFNLAALVRSLELHEQLAARSAGLATSSFRWIVHQQIRPTASSGTQLRMVKNTAYAWRQAIFFLSLIDEQAQQQTLAEFRTAWSDAPGEWRGRFEPVLVGLERVAAGERFDEQGRLAGGRRFLGWSVGAHWLLPDQATPPDS